MNENPEQQFAPEDLVPLVLIAAEVDENERFATIEKSFGEPARIARASDLRRLRVTGWLGASSVAPPACARAARMCWKGLSHALR